MPGIFDSGLADEIVEVATEETQRMTRRPGRARELPRDSVVATILCNDGEGCLSERFWMSERTTQSSDYGQR